MRRRELTDQQWGRLEPLLPAQKPQTGRPNNDHGIVINGILWVLRTGAPWRDMPERYGKWTTVSNRFYRWRKAGIWDAIWSQLQTDADSQGEIDWEVHMAAGTAVRAHQHAAGAKKQLLPRRQGRSQGGFSTKVHLRSDRRGRLMSLCLTPGLCHEAIGFETLISTGAVTRPGRGRPRLRPHRFVGDKGYCGQPVRTLLRRRGIRFTIAKRSNMCRSGPRDKQLYGQRNIVERTINRFKQFRRIATCYEKRAANYRAMWILAVIVLAP